MRSGSSHSQRIGVVADTHLPRFGSTLPPALVAGLQKARVAYIFHCGDHTTQLAVSLLERIAPVEAVLGNNDDPVLARDFPEKRILEVAGTRIGIVHGDRGKGRTTPLRALHAFEDEQVDVVCFGHSHQPYVERHGKVLLLNPGSPTDRRREPHFSYALLYVGRGLPRAEIYRYSSRTA